MSYSLRDSSTLLDMLLLAQDVREFVTAMTFETFSGDKKTRAAVLHALIVVGEASRRLSLDFKVDHPEIPWVRIGNFRNLLIHEYDKVDLPLVWRVVTAEVPQLIQNLTPLVPVEPPADGEQG
jgi:uncharacterized protein with HEPN domain